MNKKGLKNNPHKKFILGKNKNNNRVNVLYQYVLQNKSFEWHKIECFWFKKHYIKNIYDIVEDDAWPP